MAEDRVPAPRRSPLAVLEASFLLTLWAASVVCTAPLLALPLGQMHDWLTAHTLLSLRAYADWGFVTLWGASLLTPHAAELQHADPTGFAKLHGLYLSYPPGAYWLAWAGYLPARALGLASLDQAFVAGWSLLAVRLASLAGVYLALRELARLAGASVGVAVWAALAGAAAWLATPGILYYTQETYGPDQAVMPFLAWATWLALRARFDAGRLSRRAAWALGALLTVACFTDWWAWIEVVALAAAFAAGTPRAGWRAALRPWLVLPPLLAGGGFLALLLHYQRALADLVAIAAMRTGLAAPEHAPYPLWWMLVHAYAIAVDYLPVAYGVDSKDILYAINDHRWPGPVFWVGLAALLAAMAAGLWGAWRATNDRRALAIALAFLVVPPVVQIAALPEHSFVHAFSGMKFGLPLMALALVLPVARLAALPQRAVGGLLAAALAAGLVGPQAMAAPAAAWLSAGAGNATYGEAGQVIRAAVGPADLPLSDQLPVRAWPGGAWLGGQPPETNFLGGRLVYDPAYLAACLPVMPAADLARMRPVVLYFEDRGPGRFAPWCDPGEPGVIGGVIGGRVVVVRPVPRLLPRILARKASGDPTPVLPDNNNYPTKIGSR